MVGRVSAQSFGIIQLVKHDWRIKLKKYGRFVKEIETIKCDNINQVFMKVSSGGAVLQACVTISNWY